MTNLPATSMSWSREVDDTTTPSLRARCSTSFTKASCALPSGSYACVDVRPSGRPRRAARSSRRGTMRARNASFAEVLDHGHQLEARAPIGPPPSSRSGTRRCRSCRPSARAPPWAPGSRPKRVAPDVGDELRRAGVRAVVEEVARAAPRLARRRGPRRSRAVAGRDERAHVMIEVPVELRQRAEAEVEDGVHVAREDLRIDPVLARGRSPRRGTRTPRRRRRRGAGRAA